MENKQMVVPRRYQEELLRICIKGNTILYLPTGGGKTYIAVMLIKEFMQNCYMESGHPRKIAVFVVNHVALAQQQAEYIARHSGLNVGYYVGIMNVDSWDGKRWNKEIKKNQVLVMTAQIFCNIAVHNIIDVSKISVAVFDECHAATGNHPMKQALDNIVKMNPAARLLGLSGSLINGNCKLTRVIRSLQELEEAFNGKIATPKDSLLPEVAKYSTNPDEEIHYYDVTVSDEVRSGIHTMLIQCQEFVMNSKFYKDNCNIHCVPGVLDQDHEFKQNRDLKNVLENVKYQLHDLGLYGCYLMSRVYMAVLDRMVQKECSLDAVDIITVIKVTLDEIGKSIEHQMVATTNSHERVCKFTSNKFLKLVELLEEIYSNISKTTECDMERETYNVLVFVQRRSSAKTLSELLKILSETNEKLQFMKCDFVIGYGAVQSTPFTERLKKANEAAISRFRNNEINLLVTTDVLEEGIDIPHCNTVIMFDTPNCHRSYIQSKGRARQRMSRYHLLVSSEDNKFLEKYQMYKCVGHEISRVVRERGTLLDTSEVISVDEEQESLQWHMPFGSRAILSGPHAVNLVFRYCCKLPSDRYTQLSPVWYIKKKQEKYVGFVQLPVNSILKAAIQGELQSSKKLAKQSAALEVLKKLHDLGELDDDLIPKLHSDIIYHQNMYVHLTKDLFQKYSAQQGSKPQKQTYVKRCPIILSDCRPKESETTYLYIFRIQAVDPRPAEDTCCSLLYDLVNKDEHFGILSSKEIPEVFKFPLYNVVGKLNVELQKVDKTYTLSEEQICQCEEFHQFIFKKVLNIVQPFMCVDNEKREHSYLIVPTNKTESGNLQIDWKTVDEALKFKSTSKCKEKYCRFAVLSKQYSVGANQLYLITDTQEFEHSKCNENEGQSRRSKGAFVESITIPNELNCLEGKETQKSINLRRKNVDPELCELISIPPSLSVKVHLLPSILHKLCVLANAYEIASKIPISKKVGCGGGVCEGDTDSDITLLYCNTREPNLTLHDIEQALTASSCNPTFNYQTLETLGDSLLKFTVSLFLFNHYKHYHEGKLTFMKDSIVNNWHFYLIAKENDMGYKVQVHKFSPDNTWMPPGFIVPQDVCRKFLGDGISPDELKNIKLNGTQDLNDELKGKEKTWVLKKPNMYELLIGVQTVSEKTLADSLEALAAVYLKAFGLFGAVEFLNSWGVLPAEFASPTALFETKPEKPILHKSLSNKDVDFLLGNVEGLEKTLHYRFQDRGFLLQALTHPSFQENRITDCYQRLEFLGDAILDFLVTGYLHEKCQNATPGKITALRSALVNNSKFATISVRIGLQKYCKYRSSQLFYNIDEFLKLQEEKCHHLTYEVENEVPKSAAPKVLSDLFESVAAAVYLDSGKCLKTVWTVYYQIMKEDIEELL